MMAFDIHQRVCDDDGACDEEEALRYRNEIMARFSTSPEGQKVATTSGFSGWADTFMAYGTDYMGVTPPEMSPAQVEEILFDIFPRKVSALPGAGEEIILELRAFWAFLQREFQLANAGACLQMLQGVTGDDLEQEMQNPQNFGMAKSFFMLGQAGGFDMTTQEGIQAFTEIYNASLATGAPPSLPRQGPSPVSRSDPHPKRATKKTAARRKMAQTSRRKNRKK
jgi:hypothetical protein